MTNEEIDQLIDQMCVEGEEKAFKFAEQLGHLKDEYVVDRMIELLSSESDDVKYLAAKTLSNSRNNARALSPLFEAIHAKENEGKNGGLVEALSGFDLSNEFVNIFRLFLSKSFKVESMAKVMLDFTEFEITPRVIRKAEKHWNHYVHNTPKDELFDLKEMEVNELLGELKELFPEE